MWETPALFLRLYKKQKHHTFRVVPFFLLVENTGIEPVTLLQSMHGAPLGELSPHSFGNNKKAPHVSV